MVENLRLKLHRIIVASYDDAVQILKEQCVASYALCVRYCIDGNIEHANIASNIGMLFGIGMLDNQENPFYISSELDGFLGGVTKYIIEGVVMTPSEAIQWLADHCLYDPEEIVVTDVFAKSELYQLANLILGLPVTDDDGTLLEKMTKIYVCKDDIRRALNTDDKVFENYAEKIKELN